MHWNHKAFWVGLSLAVILLPGCGSQGAPSVKASGGAATFGVLGQIAAPRLDPVPLHPQRFPTRIIAHRGFSGSFPENTVSAFRGAVQAGADLVELDVQLTKDGELVVMHDDKVDRTTNGTGKVQDLTFEQVRSLDAGSKFDPKFAGERVPTLEEALDAVYGGAMLNIEVKNIEQPSSRPLVAQKIRELLDRKNYASHVQIMSFDEDFLAEMRQQAPGISMAMLRIVDPFNLKIRQARKLKLDGLNLLYRTTTRDEVEDIHRAGLTTHVYTVNRLHSMLTALRRGVDGVITNYPDKAALVMDTYYNSKSMPTMQEVADEDVD